MKRLIGLIAGRPGLVAISLLVVSAALLVPASRLELSTDLPSLLPDNSPAAQAYHAYLDRFGAAERVFIMVVEGEDHEEVGRTIQQRYQVIFSFFLIVSVVIIEEIESGLGILDQLFFIILVILMLVAFFSLAMNLMASILEREFELGILRSLGLRAGALRNALVAEGVAISMVAMFVGLVVGVTMSALVIWFFNTLSPIDFEYAIPWPTVISSLQRRLWISTSPSR